MQGPKINPPSDSMLLLTLKRKGGPNKTLTCRSKKRLHTKLLNVSDMAGVLASAFQVLILCFFSFFLHLQLIFSLLQSSGLIGQSEQTNASDGDLVSEPIQ
jgi:uncharacterized iron-regulated membrane protein